MDWYLKVLKNYVGFEGRARRTEFWMFVVFNVIISSVLLFLAVILNFASFTLSSIFWGLLSIYYLGILLPSIAVSIRRLHDIGQSGWLILVGLIPAIGGIILLVLMVLEGKPGENQYGPNPKEV